MRYFFKSINLIGDGLNISPAWRAWLKRSGVDYTDEVYMQTLPDHAAPLYAGMVRDLGIKLQTVFERPTGEFKFEHTFDVSKAFRICDEKKIHIAEAYAELLGVELPGERKPPGANDPRLKPTYIPTDDKWMEGPHQPIGSLKGCILISMFSASCRSRDPNHKGLPPTTMPPFIKWKPMLKYLRTTFYNTPIRFLGAPGEIFPEELKEAVEWGQSDVDTMYGIPINRLALIMRNAKLLVTVGNGMSHLAASQETPTFLLYQKCLGLHYILTTGNPNLEYMHMDPAMVNPAEMRFKLIKAVERFKL